MKNYFDQALVFLDTETTGLDHRAQIIEIAIVDREGEVLVNHRLKPSVPIEEQAQAIHGISPIDLSDCPQWPEVETLIKEALIGKKVVIYNAEFDIRLLRQTAEAFGCDTAWIDNLVTDCAMAGAVRRYGATSLHGTISLTSAVKRSGCGWHGKEHSALGDALTTLALVRKIAD